MVVTTRGILAMTRKEVNMMLQALGWKPEAGVKITMLKKKYILRMLLERLSPVK